MNFIIAKSGNDFSFEFQKGRKGKRPEKLRRNKRRTPALIKKPKTSKKFRRGKKVLQIFMKGPESQQDRKLLIRYDLLDATIAHKIFYPEELYLPLETWYIVPHAEV